MIQEKWQEIKEKIKSNFEILSESNEKDEERREDIETIEFTGPMGKMKVEWITRPKVLDKKTQYSNRIGSSVSVNYVYSPDEVTNTFKVYQWNAVNEDWREINGESLM